MSIPIDILEEVAQMDATDLGTSTAASTDIDRKALANQVIEYIEQHGIENIDSLVDDLSLAQAFNFNRRIHNEWVVKTFGPGTKKSMICGEDDCFIYDPMGFLGSIIPADLYPYPSKGSIILILPFLTHLFSPYPDMGQANVIEFGLGRHIGSTVPWMNGSTECDVYELPYEMQGVEIRCGDGLVTGMRQSPRGYSHFTSNIFPHSQVDLGKLVNYMTATAEVRTSETRLVITDMYQSLVASREQVGSRAKHMLHQAETNKSSADDFVSQIARLRRAAASLREDANILKSGLQDRVIEDFQQDLMLPDALMSHKGVKHAEIKQLSTGTQLVVETYPFHMHVEFWCEDRDEDCEETIRVQPAVITIQTSQDNPHIRILPTEGSSALCHPNVSYDGNICFGHADVPIAESWGIRDWHGVVNLVLAWMTQHGDEEPYRSISTLIDEYGAADYRAAAGWQIPADPVEETNSEEAA